MTSSYDEFHSIFWNSTHKGIGDIWLSGATAKSSFIFTILSNKVSLFFLISTVPTFWNVTIFMFLCFFQTYNANGSTWHAFGVSFIFLLNIILICDYIKKMLNIFAVWPFFSFFRSFSNCIDKAFANTKYVSLYIAKKRFLTTHPTLNDYRHRHTG